MSTDPYTRYHLGSKPKFTNAQIDKQIANLLDLINNEKNKITDKQLEVIQQKIKEKIQLKRQLYLVSTDSPPVRRAKHNKRVTFKSKSRSNTKSNSKSQRKKWLFIGVCVCCEQIMKRARMFSDIFQVFAIKPVLQRRRAVCVAHLMHCFQQFVALVCIVAGFHLRFLSFVVNIII